MKVYFITRFSIFDQKGSRWRLSKKITEAEYKRRIFSKERLEEKFGAFEKMVLPSIVGQTNQNYEWLIITSEHLPPNYKNRLNKLIAPHKKNIKIFFAKNMRDFWQLIKNYPYQKNFATVRLDDDDGLNKEYVEMVQQYQNNKKCIVSFPYGHKYKLENNNIVTKPSPIYIPRLGLGLCAIGMEIYTCGNHMKIDQKFRVIYNMTRSMYYLFCSPHTDTNRRF